jgi:hypothetical protein
LHVFLDLKIEHAHADEVRAVFERVAEGGFGADRAGGQGLEGDPGLLDFLPEAMIPMEDCVQCEQCAFLQRDRDSHTASP